MSGRCAEAERLARYDQLLRECWDLTDEELDDLALAEGFDSMRV